MTSSVDCVLINSPDQLYSRHYLADPKIPLGLLYLASYLRSRSVRVKVLDCHMLGFAPDKLVQMVRDTGAPLVGLNVTTPNRKVVYELAERLKERANIPMVVLGGPHASCCPEDVFRNAPHVDGVIMGEGEETLAMVAENLGHCHSFPGFCERADAYDPSARRMAPRIRNLDSLPMPAYELIDVEEYRAISPELYLATSRGCQYHCVFCCSHVLLGQEVVFRSLDSVCEEIKQLKKRYAIDSFYFYDDNLLIWPRLEEFCNKNHPPSFRWTAQANINDLRINLISQLGSAGCYRLSFGFESGCSTIQKYVGKVIKADAFEKISRLREAGISSRAFFIVGFPNENIHDIVETAKYIMKLRVAGLEDIAIFPARPFPGTRLLSDCLSIFGDDKLENLLEFKYLDDFRNETEPWIRARLQRYNTIPSFQINKYFDSLQVRKIIRDLYCVFCEHKRFADMSDRELARHLDPNIEK